MLSIFLCIYFYSTQDKTMSKTIQPRLGTVVTMIVAILFLFLLFSQAGKYHQSGYIVEKAEERLALNQERQKAMLYIGVNDDIALKVKPIEIPLNKTPEYKTTANAKTTTSTVEKITTDPNINHALAYAKQIQQNDSSKSPAKKNNNTYTVRQGDTLFGIAQKVYGDGNKWRVILQNNKHLTKPNSLRSGMKLKIPEPLQENTAYIKWQKTNTKRS